MEKKIKQRRNRRISRVGLVILGVVGVSGIIAIAAVAPGVGVILEPFFKRKKYSRKQAIRRNTDSLIEQGFIEIVKKDGKPYALKITKKGKWELGIRGYLRREKSQKNKSKWDFLWRIVVFDVPEEKRVLRRELRRAVKMYGFEQLQKSVWVYPYPCEDFVTLIKDNLGIKNNVVYLTANFIENDAELRRKFKLCS